MTGEPRRGAPSDVAPPKELSGQLRNVVSLLIFIHLFGVVTALFGNQYETASNLQMRVMSFLGPYTRTLWFDPQVTVGYHLTHAMEFEDDHLVEVQGNDGNVIGRYPDPQDGQTGLRGGLRYHRWRALMRRVAMNVEGENDEYLAQLGRAIGEHQLEAGDDTKLQLRIVRRRPIDLYNEAATEDGPDSYDTVYTADVWRDDQGNVRLLKQVDTGEAAPVDAGS